MTNYGYSLMCEQSGPRALVEHAARELECDAYRGNRDFRSFC